MLGAQYVFEKKMYVFSMYILWGSDEASESSEITVQWEWKEWNLSLLSTGQPVAGTAASTCSEMKRIAARLAMNHINEVWKIMKQK